MGYDPTIGVWFERDPAKVGTNLNEYVGGAPTGFVDPAGASGVSTSQPSPVPQSVGGTGPRGSLFSISPQGASPVNLRMQELTAASIRSNRIPPVLLGYLRLTPENLGTENAQVRINLNLRRVTEGMGDTLFKSSYRQNWKAQTEGPHEEWMRNLHVYGPPSDNPQSGWLWPNLPWLFNIKGKEYEERYGGASYTGHNDDFGAVLVRGYEAVAGVYKESTRTAGQKALVTATWTGRNRTGKNDIVDFAKASSLTISLPTLQTPDTCSPAPLSAKGQFKIWFVYADSCKSIWRPRGYPPEFNGMAIAQFVVDWTYTGGTAPQFTSKIVNVTVPKDSVPDPTGFDWEKWVTAGATDRLSDR